jgi:hypothetical protein
MWRVDRVSLILVLQASLWPIWVMLVPVQWVEPFATDDGRPKTNDRLGHQSPVIGHFLSLRALRALIRSAYSFTGKPEAPLFYSQFPVHLALQREIKYRRAFYRFFEPQELRVGFQVVIDFFLRGNAVPRKGGTAEAVGSNAICWDTFRCFASISAEAFSLV